MESHFPRCAPLPYLVSAPITGRPDGKRPFGFPSLLDYYCHATEARREDPDAAADLRAQLREIEADD
jgi:hypothetical protein